MSTSEDVIGYLRTLLKGDVDANDEYERRLDDAGWDGFPRLLGAMFFLAVERRFGPVPSATDVIRFVADLRVGLDADAPYVDPAAAEALIRAVGDESIGVTTDPQQIGTIQTLVAYEILGGDDISDSELESTLREAAELADR